MKYNRASLFTAISISLLFACNNSKDYKTDDDTSSKQTAIAQQSNVDTAAMNNGGSTAPANTDTATMNAAPVTDNTAAGTDKMDEATIKPAKPNPAKKGHKGQIRVAKYSPRMTGKMEEDKNGVYNYSEVLPMYPGGESDLARYIQNHVEYPQEAIDNGVEGTVYVNFAVDEKGKIYSPEVRGRKLGYGLDEEAMKVVNDMPKWTPGSIKGKNVKTHFSLPITFTLE